MVEATLLKRGITEDFLHREWGDIEKLEFLSADEAERYKRIYAIAAKWVRSVSQTKKVELGLFMYGSNGSGKTTLACIIAKHFIKHKIPARRVTMTRVQAEFYENWRVPEIGLINEVLIIDECGKEYKTKNEHSEICFEYILKYRAERKLPTILVSNADIVFLYRRYGETVNSVLKGSYLPLAFPEVDMRQRQAEIKINEFMR